MTYTTMLTFVFVIFFSPFLPSAHVSSQQSTSSQPLDSPRLAALVRELKTGNGEALQRFWEEMKDKAPLVETIPDDNGLRLVTFLWRGGDEACGIKQIAPLPFVIRNKLLTRLESTDVWFMTVRLPSAARFSYAFEGSSGRQFGDSLNPLTRGVDSVAELPDAPPQPWIQPDPNVPKGTLKEEKLKSEILKEERTVSVYTPPGYDPRGGPYRLLIVFDGEVYRSIVPVPTILDNLLARQKILPQVAILVDGGRSRNRDLICSPAFADFMAKELVPWARQHYRISADPKQTTICGSSYGGLSATYCAFRYPKVFGNVLSQSGSFWYYPGYKHGDETESAPFGWLTRQFETTPKLPIRFYLEVGLFETGYPHNQLTETRSMRDVLKAKGYSVVYSEFAGGHEYLCWRGSLADGLIALAGNRNK